MSIELSIVKIKNWIIERINQHQFNIDEPLPSFYTISRQLDVSQDDVEKAFQELITEQIVTERFQEGYFIKPDPIFFYPINELFSLTTMIEEKGYSAGTIIISQDPEIPTIDDKKMLNLKNDKEILVIERLRTANGQPVAYCLDKLRDTTIDIPMHLANMSLFEQLKCRTDFQIAYATSEIEAISYEPYISNTLECAPEDSLLLFKQVHYNKQDEPILYSLNYFKSSQVKFQIKREVK